MNNTFLICGYPRSRTLWMSKFLTIPGYSLCTHEATENAGSSEEFWSNAESAKVESYGNSDSANIFILLSLLAQKPMTKVIWIARPLDEVCRSMRTSGMPCEDKSLLTIRAFRDRHWNCFDAVFDYLSLSHHQVCAAIWKMCLPGLEFDYDRWRAFNGMRICYSKMNPYPQKDFKKFLAWVNKDLSEEKEMSQL